MLYPLPKLSTIIISTLTLLKLATSTNALGCYNSGLRYGDVTDNADVLLSARKEACNYFKGSYPQGAAKAFCLTIGKNRINFETKNNAGTTQVLSVEDCVAAFTIEMNACSRGSQQNHGSFFYNNDPNAGVC